MEYLELLKNFLVGVLSNVAYDQIRSDHTEKQPHQDIENNEIKNEQKDKIDIQTSTSFPVKSLYAYYSDHPNDWFLPLIKIIHEPNVYIFLEVEPSTFYNLGAVILEDNRTKDWFPFYKEIALQGSGGGWDNTERLYNQIQQIEEKGKKVAISLRIANNQDTLSLQEGRISWADYKNKTVPALICRDEVLGKLQERFYHEVVKIK